MKPEMEMESIEMKMEIVEIEMEIMEIAMTHHHHHYHHQQQQQQQNKKQKKAFPHLDPNYTSIWLERNSKCKIKIGDTMYYAPKDDFNDNVTKLRRWN